MTPDLTAVQFCSATQIMIVKLLLFSYLVFFVYVDIITERYIMLAMDIFIPVILYGIIIVAGRFGENKQ